MDDAEGYHDTHFSGIPYGFVFLELSKKLKEDWTVTLSHEALELIGDPEANLLVQGPHPTDATHKVFHWFEMCDAVQNESYTIDHVRVSNFVLPLYFTRGNERGGRNDFLGTTTKDGNTLRSFSVNPGGYVGFFDPTRAAIFWAALTACCRIIRFLPCPTPEFVSGSSLLMLMEGCDVASRSTQVDSRGIPGAAAAPRRPGSRGLRDRPVWRDGVRSSSQFPT
jgi:hypothetical protein